MDSFGRRPLAFLALPAAAQSGQLAGVLNATLHEQGFDVKPSDIAAGTEWKAGIQDVLRRSDVVVADLSGADPNVIFEVGLAFGMLKPVLLLSQDKEIASDIRAYQVARYRPDQIDLVRQYLALWLRDTMATA